MGHGDNMKSQLLMYKSALNKYHQSNKIVFSHYPFVNLHSHLNEHS